MVGLLAYSPDRNIVGITAMAGFTIVTDTTVREAGCRLEGQVRVVVARETILLRGQMCR